MVDITIALDRASHMGLQDQLRQRLVEAIYTGALPPGRKMPSSRALAAHLGVSRNTVVLAYSDLVADGYIDARSRSGNFVSYKSLDGKVVGRRLPSTRESPIADRMVTLPAGPRVRCPPRWRQYPYPFWDGRIDTTLVPAAEWRKAVRLASCRRDTLQWSEGNGELDDPMLIEELRTKVLPERGISALAEEVLMHHCLRQAVQSLISLLVQPGTPVWVEEPVDAELFAMLRECHAQVEQFHAGMTGPPPEGVVLITSARSGITSGSFIQPARVQAVARQGGVVIELATPADTTEPAGMRPALYAGARTDHVIHVGCLSPVAACSTPLAYVVSDAAVIARLRRARRVAGAVPGPLQQRAWAYFLSLGYYAAALKRARGVLTARKTALRDALNHYLHAVVDIQTVPGISAYWVRCRSGEGTLALPGRAPSAGVLVQPARFHQARGAFMMGVTGIPEERIRDGVRALAHVFRASWSREEADTGTHKALSGAAVRRAISGRTLLYNTVYGEPCTIQVRRSGDLVGMAGYDNDDPDHGRWWIRDQHWFRQWDHWAYGEAEGFVVAIEDDRIYWYDDDGHLVDKAVILPGKQRKTASNN